MTKIELENKIEELQKQIDELKNVKIEEKQKKWKPALGEKYYYINVSGEIYYYDFDNDEFDNDCIKLGNCYRTKKEAEFAVNKIKYTQMFKRFIEERSDPIDWRNKEKKKWYIAYDFEEHHIEIDFDEYFMSQGTIYASSEQILKDAVAYVGEENVKKYILGVEE